MFTVINLEFKRDLSIEKFCQKGADGMVNNVEEQSDLGLHCLLWTVSENLGSLGYSQHMSPKVRKPIFWISNKVPHKPGCTPTKDVRCLEFLI